MNMKVGVFTSHQRIRDLDSSLVIRALEIEAHSFKAGVQMTLISHCRWLFLTVIHFPKDILFFHSHNGKHYKGLGTQSEWFSVRIVSWHSYLKTLKILIHMPFLLLQSVHPFNENVAIPFTKRPWKQLTFPKEKRLTCKMPTGCLHEKTQWSLPVTAEIQAYISISKNFL